ncbi:hypothetical protein HDV00_005124 [Rhizophlyctis rosea]|nr:hypothetical protein HDV00_005124 [Rhizophlyctis rosea]
MRKNSVAPVGVAGDGKGKAGTGRDNVGAATVGGAVGGAGGGTVAAATSGQAGGGAASLGKEKAIDEGFLGEIQAGGFSGVWNHPISRCYFLMFLIGKGYQNLYFFRMDALQYRLDFPTLYSSARKSHSLRIYNTYISKVATLPISWPVPAAVTASTASAASILSPVSPTSANSASTGSCSTTTSSLPSASATLTSQSGQQYSQSYSQQSPTLLQTQSPLTPPSLRNLNVARLLGRLKQALDGGGGASDASVFDDLAFLALNVLEDLYEGREGEASPSGTSPGGDDAERAGQGSVDESGVISGAVGQDNGEANGFVGSAFWQAMRNDLRGTRHLTTIQYNRAAERITDLPPHLYCGPDMWEKLMTSLEAMGVDCESFRVRGAGAGMLYRKGSQRGHALGSRAKSLSSLDGKKPLNASEVSDDGLAAGAGPAAPPKEWKRLQTYVGGDQAFCEYCFRHLVYDKGGEDAGAAYRCEACGLMCHKNCRNSTHVTCVKPSATLDLELGTAMHSEKMRRVNEKIAALQREVDIEMKIRDGLDKMHRAKSYLTTGVPLASSATPTSATTGGAGGGATTGSKKVMTPAELEINSQVERSNKKLDVLKHELQRCRLQLTSLVAEEAAAAAAAAATAAAVESLAKNGVEKKDNTPDVVGGAAPMLTSPSVAELGSSASAEGEVVKVVSLDSMMKAESTKAFFITPQHTAKQLIQLALEKFLLPGTEEDYLISYQTESDIVPLRYEDHPLKLGLNIMETPFHLKAKFDPSSLAARSRPQQPKPSGSDLTQQRKQREVLMEICETELNYTEDLKSIVFKQPLMRPGGLNEETANAIFSNIEQLADLHTRISKGISEKRDDLTAGGNMVQAIVGLFAENVESFAEYEQYCGNQHNARRTLNKLRQDPPFAKSLQACESNPRLNKLTLADLLVKPMHRITRYPILLKRLLSLIRRTEEDYQVVNDLINRVEAKVADINEMVRKQEAGYRINLIDENIDFNNVTERFKIANGRRELISEKTFTYLKKNTNGTVEVIVMFFTDMLLITRMKRPDNFLLFKPPIPFEAVVFLDKPDAPGMKNMFQVIHLQQEIHTLQSISSFDKNQWLQDAENIRCQFSLIHYNFEHTNMRDAADRWRQPSLLMSTVPEMDFDGVMNAAGEPILNNGELLLEGMKASPPSSSVLSRRRTTHSSSSSSKLKGDGGESVNDAKSKTTVGSLSRESGSALLRASSWGNLFRTKSTEVSKGPSHEDLVGKSAAGGTPLKIATNWTDPPTPGGKSTAASDVGSDIEGRSRMGSHGGASIANSEHFTWEERDKVGSTIQSVPPRRESHPEGAQKQSKKDEKAARRKLKKMKKRPISVVSEGGNESEGGFSDRNSISPGSDLQSPVTPLTAGTEASMPASDSKEFSDSAQSPSPVKSSGNGGSGNGKSTSPTKKLGTITKSFFSAWSHRNEPSKRNISKSEGELSDRTEGKREDEMVRASVAETESSTSPRRNKVSP